MTRNRITHFASLAALLAITMQPHALWALLAATLVTMAWWRSPAEATGGLRLKGVTAATCLLLLIAFSLRWKDTPLPAPLAGRVSSLLASQAVGAVLALASWHAVKRILAGFLPAALLSVDPSQAAGDATWRDRGFTALLAIVLMTLFSRSSPLYPLNIWCDANCFFTMGKGIVHGLVPYRDLYEQKGPLLYFLHAATFMVSNTSFTGVWLLEMACCYAFLRLARRLLAAAGSRSWWMLAAVGTLVAASPCFSYGDSAEELCLPLVAWGLWQGLRLVMGQHGRFAVRMMSVGMAIGAIFWIKYSILGFYVGWTLFFTVHYARRKQWGRLLRMAGALAAGFVLVSVPIVAYFATHNALPHLIEAYFTNNIVHYHTGTDINPGLFYSLTYGAVNAVTESPAFFIVALAAVAAAYSRRGVWFLVALSFAATMVLIYFRYPTYVYYPLPVAVFLPFGLTALWQWTTRLVPLPRWRTAMAATALALVALCSGNVWHMCQPREQLPQYRFAGIIGSGHDTTLLNYGTLDGGFYTVLNQVPQCRFYGTFNLDLPLMTLEQQRFLDRRRATWVVTENEPLRHRHYTIADSARSEDGHWWYLYQRK